jgi:hypothetical protein
VLSELVVAAGLYELLSSVLPDSTLEATAYRSRGVVEVGVVGMFAGDGTRSLPVAAMFPLELGAEAGA